jgi:hypothetical protein
MRSQKGGMATKIIIFLVLAGIWCVDCEDAFAVAVALHDIIQEFYVKTGIRFDIIIYGERTHHINDVIDYLGYINAQLYPREPLTPIDPLKIVYNMTINDY